MKLRTIKRRTERRQMACAHKRRFGERLTRLAERRLRGWVSDRFEDTMMRAFNAARSGPTA